jgi:hypothetical protein
LDDGHDSLLSQHSLPKPVHFIEFRASTQAFEKAGPLGITLGHSRQQVRHWGIVAKRFADVNVKVDVAGREDEGSSQLEGVLPQLVLPVARSLCTGPRHAVIVPQEVQQRTDSKVDGAIRNSIRIDQEREVDARVFPEQASVLHVA